MDLCQAGDVVITYAKLGRLILIGFVNEPNPQHWKGTKINANEGFVGNKNYTLPSQSIEYINHKARIASEAARRVSETQNAKIDHSFRMSIDRAASSDYFRAMQADVDRFGNDAFLRDQTSKPQDD